MWEFSKDLKAVGQLATTSFGGSAFLRGRTKRSSRREPGMCTEQSEQGGSDSRGDGNIHGVWSWAKKLSVWYHNGGQYVIYLSKLIECTTPGMNSNVNYKLWVIMMCQCHFISCKTCTTLGGNAATVEGCRCVGSGDIWEISALSAQFCCLT